MEREERERERDKERERWRQRGWEFSTRPSPVKINAIHDLIFQSFFFWNIRDGVFQRFKKGSPAHKPTFSSVVQSLNGVRLTKSVPKGAVKGAIPKLMAVTNMRAESVAIAIVQSSSGFFTTTRNPRKNMKFMLNLHN